MTGMSASGFWVFDADGRSSRRRTRIWPRFFIRRVLLEPREFERVLVEHLALRHAAGEPREAHRVDVGVENHEVEMPDDDRERREDRLVEVDRTRDIEAELGEQADGGVVEPQDRAGDALQER